MKKYIFLLILPLFVACNSDKKLCECVEAGAEANRISASFFDREPTQEGKDSLTVALENRDKLCAPFQNMLADELQQRAANCKNLEFNPED